ncbi:MAG: addiction module antidote protein [Thiohalomonadales bacterium]
MGSRNVRETHNKQLRDSEVAAEYINQALESGDSSIILMALRNIVEAQSDGISGVASRANLGRESMYKMLSTNGNPKLSSLTSLLKSIGLQLYVEPTKNIESPTQRLS